MTLQRKKIDIFLILINTQRGQMSKLSCFSCPLMLGSASGCSQPRTENRDLWLLGGEMVGVVSKTLCSALLHRKTQLPFCFPCWLLYPCPSCIFVPPSTPSFLSFLTPHVSLQNRIPQIGVWGFSASELLARSLKTQKIYKFQGKEPPAHPVTCKYIEVWWSGVDLCFWHDS